MPGPGYRMSWGDIERRSRDITPGNPRELIGTDYRTGSMRTPYQQAYNRDYRAYKRAQDRNIRYGRRNKR